MDVTDPTFGGGGFNADLFRNGIRNAMIMGTPVDPTHRATFRWIIKRHYTTADTAGMPFNFGSTPTSTDERDDVQVPVAMEFMPGPLTGTSIGAFHEAQMVLTVLDEDYALVETADEVSVAGKEYDIVYVGPPIGLFSVTIYQMYCQAKGEP